jgi:phage tail sheath protein FI
MATNIGLNVIEVDGSAPATIQGAATSTGAFNIVTRRGVPNRPVRVTSFAEFVERFGGYEAGSLGAYLVRGFFDNGGRRAWINRVAGSGASAPKAASGILRQGTAQNAAALLRLDGGYRGQSDPGAWAEGISIALRPSFQSGVREGTQSIGKGGTTLASLAGFSVGDTVIVREGGDRALVTVTELNPATGEISWTPEIANNADFAAAETVVASTDFDLSIAGAGEGAATVESWTRLTLRRGAPNYAVTMLNDPSRGSRYVLATDSRQAANQTTPDSPGEEVAAVLTGSAEGAVSTADFIGDEAVHTGFHAFDPLDVQLVCVESTDASVVAAALAYCEERGDCTFVGSVPEALPVSDAIEYGAGFQGKKVYGALYGPWISVADPIAQGQTKVKRVPPTGHVMGVYARIETTRGIHKAPAGDEARLLGALDVEYQLSDAEHTDLVTMGSVNGIRAIPGAGIVVDASRTLSTDIRWRYVNVRLLFNYVKSSLRQGLRWVRQEPNKDTLWDAVKFGSVRPFLMGLWRQGSFGTGDPDEVFTIICDETNNPPDEVDKGNFKLEVYFYPSKPAETILIVVGQQPSGSTASEA